MRSASLLSLAVVLTVVNVAEAQPPATPLTASVRSVDPTARTLEVVTGVGYALRVVKLSCPPSTVVKSTAGAASLGELKRGDIVRVDYAKTAEGNVAKTIEVLPKPPGGGR